MKKFLTKAVAALASAVTLSSMAGAIPTSAIDMSYGVGKNSSMRYTVYTTRISRTELRLTVKILDNPGIRGMLFAVKNESGCQYEDMEVVKKGTAVDCYNPSLGQTAVVYRTNITSAGSNSAAYGTIELSLNYKIIGSVYDDYKFQIGFLQYDSPNEPEAKFTAPDLNFSDATIEVSPSETVRIGDLDNNNAIEATDVFYLQQMVEQAPNNKLSTTYLDTQLKNRNSTWSKNYPFLKCALVADVDRDEVIQQKDADELMHYVAQVGAGTTASNKNINTLFPVTVVYDN